MQSRMRSAVFIAALALVFSACATDNSDEAQERLQACDNGVVDDHEECDDGNRLDNDACLSSCVLATCGDDFVFAGIEECDGINLDPDGSFDPAYSCANLLHDGGTLRCTSDCRHDVSDCGPTYTPTPTPTATLEGIPTGTPTTTATPTPTRNPMCGNRTVEPGETCDDGNEEENDPCPNDCVINPCTPAGTTRTVQVDFAPPPFQDASSISLLVTYPDGSVSLPGFEGDPSVVARITGRQTGATVQPNDYDHALLVVYTRPGRINPGRVFLAAFDECTAAPTTEADDFSCRVVGCSNSSGSLDGCTCSVVEPE